jgi:hypothetical protein
MVKELMPEKKLKNKKDILQFLPKSLEQLSKNNYQIYKERKLRTSYILDIIHNLLLKYYFKKENSFNLSSTILKKRYGMDYNYYINYLKDNNYINLIKNHQKGKNSRIYELNSNIIKGEITRYRNSDTFILKKYRSSISDRTDTKNLILSDVKEKLVNDLFHVEIDYLSSLSYLEMMKDDIDAYNKNKYSVECIEDGHIFYHFDDYGRMHTNFTILKSSIRKNCLLIDGEKTCEIDIPNSQPLFLTKLIFDENCFTVDNTEYLKFKSLTMNGDFYKHLIEVSGDIVNKKQIKELVYRILFGRNYKGKYEIFFKKQFPTILEFIKSYKREHGDYRKVSHDLQRAESNLIFNKIVRKIMVLYPEIKVITIHDSIIVQKKYEEVVKIIFNKLLREEFEYIN